MSSGPAGLEADHAATGGRDPDRAAAIAAWAIGTTPAATARSRRPTSRPPSATGRTDCAWAGRTRLGGRGQAELGGGALAEHATPVVSSASRTDRIGARRTRRSRPSPTPWPRRAVGQVLHERGHAANGTAGAPRSAMRAIERVARRAEVRCGLGGRDGGASRLGRRDSPWRIRSAVSTASQVPIVTVGFSHRRLDLPGAAGPFVDARMFSWYGRFARRRCTIAYPGKGVSHGRLARVLAVSRSPVSSPARRGALLATYVFGDSLVDAGKPAAVVGLAARIRRRCGGYSTGGSRTASLRRRGQPRDRGTTATTVSRAGTTSVRRRARAGYGRHHPRPAGQWVSTTPPSAARRSHAST